MVRLGDDEGFKRSGCRCLMKRGFRGWMGLSVFRLEAANLWLSLLAHKGGEIDVVGRCLFLHRLLNRQWRDSAPNRRNYRVCILANMTEYLPILFPRVLYKLSIAYMKTYLETLVRPPS